MGLNAYRELCTLQISGDGVFIRKEAVLSCANVAASRAVEMVEMLKKCLAADAAERYIRHASPRTMVYYIFIFMYIYF